MDERVTALGLHIEGIDDIRAFEALAQTGRRLEKPIVVLKVGVSDGARTAASNPHGVVGRQRSRRERALSNVSEWDRFARWRNSLKP